MHTTGLKVRKPFVCVVCGPVAEPVWLWTAFTDLLVSIFPSAAHTHTNAAINGTRVKAIKREGEGEKVSYLKQTNCTWEGAFKGLFCFPSTKPPPRADVWHDVFVCFAIWFVFCNGKLKMKEQINRKLKKALHTQHVSPKCRHGFKGSSSNPNWKMLKSFLIVFHVPALKSRNFAPIDVFWAKSFFSAHHHGSAPVGVCWV